MVAVLVVGLLSLWVFIKSPEVVPEPEVEPEPEIDTVRHTWVDVRAAPRHRRCPREPPLRWGGGERVFRTAHRSAGWWWPDNVIK